MSLRSWSILLFFYLLYLALGGYLFRSFERPHDCETVRKELEKHQQLSREIRQLKKMLNRDQLERLSRILDITDQIEDIKLEKLYHWKETKKRAKLKNALMEEQVHEEMLYEIFYNDEKKNKLSKVEDDPRCDKWSYFNSFFFSFTAITTIGYGHLSPLTQNGKITCIIYSLLGVPFNGILIGNLGAYFSLKLQNFRQMQPQSPDDNQIKRMAILFFRVVAFMVPGVVIFLVLPAVAFYNVEENWTYLDSIYFSFITLTTIGFGDFVAGRSTQLVVSGWRIVYGISIIIWVIFGLGYVFMIISVISDGLTFPAIEAAKRFRMAEKHLVSVILNEVMKTRRKKANDQNEALDEEETSVTIVDESDEDDKVRNEVANINIAARRDLSIRERPTVSLPNVDAERELTVGTSSDNVEGLIEEMNDDTITSLHDFMTSAIHFQKSMRVCKATTPATSPSHSVTLEGEFPILEVISPTPPSSRPAKSSAGSKVSLVGAEEMNRPQNGCGDSVKSLMSSNPQEPNARPNSAMSSSSILNWRLSGSEGKSSTKSLANRRKYREEKISVSSLPSNSNAQPHVPAEQENRQHSLPHAYRNITLEEVLNALESLGLDKEEVHTNDEDH